jgi:hypothetical protein
MASGCMFTKLIVKKVIQNLLITLIFKTLIFVEHSSQELSRKSMKKFLQNLCLTVLRTFVRILLRMFWEYSQHFIFIVTYEWAQWVRVLHYTRLKRLAKDKLSSLLDPFVSYKENKLHLIQYYRENPTEASNKCLLVN